MGRKARRKSAVKAKKRLAAVTAKKRKPAAKMKSKPARRKGARKAKPKGMLAEIAGGFEAVMDTLSDAERLRHKLEPRMAADPE